MKLYVDELPRSCGDCVFFKETEYCYYCDKLHMKLGYINKEKDCPLQSLADYAKKVRKEVCEEIKDKLKLKEKFHPEDDFEIDYDFYYKEDVEEVLDQIQGETK